MAAPARQISPIGARIIQMLNGRTQRWLCAETGLPRQTVNKVIVHGTMPSADKAISIARALNVSVEWLILGQDLPPAPPSPKKSFWQRLCRVFGGN